MKPTKPKPKKQLPLFNGSFAPHDRYFQTAKGMYEMISGWKGGSDMSKWEVTIVQVDPITRQRMQPEIILSGQRSEIIREIKKYEQKQTL